MLRAALIVRLISLLVAASALVVPAVAEQPIVPQGGVENLTEGQQSPTELPPPDLNGHPLQPAMDMAWRAQQGFHWANDYTCTLLKNERVDGELTGHDALALKVRRKPFSLYIYCLGPVKPRGQEAIYVDGENDNLVLAHAVGLKKIAGTMRLEPTHPRLMEGNRHPLSKAGIDNLLQRIIAGYRADAEYGECQVKVIPNATVDGRLCDVVQVVHPVRRTNFRYYLARVYYDRELNVPIRWEAYDWPAKEGGSPVLLEEYTYRNLKFNVGLADSDFDPANPSYGFE